MPTNVLANDLILIDEALKNIYSFLDESDLRSLASVSKDTRESVAPVLATVTPFINDLRYKTPLEMELFHQVWHEFSFVYDARQTLDNYKVQQGRQMKAGAIARAQHIISFPFGNLSVKPRNFPGVIFVDTNNFVIDDIDLYIQTLANLYPTGVFSPIYGNKMLNSMQLKSELHPRMASRIRRFIKQQNEPLQTICGLPGCHAEVRAVNEVYNRAFPNIIDIHRQVRSVIRHRTVISMSQFFDEVDLTCMPDSITYNCIKSFLGQLPDNRMVRYFDKTNIDCKFGSVIYNEIRSFLTIDDQSKNYRIASRFLRNLIDKSLDIHVAVVRLTSHRNDNRRAAGAAFPACTTCSGILTNDVCVVTGRARTSDRVNNSPFFL